MDHHTNITDTDATGRTTTTLVDCHDRGSLDYYCRAGGGTTCFECPEPEPGRRR